MTKIAAPRAPATLIDPWATAPASWVALAGTRTQRAQAAQAPMKPALWRHLVDPRDRAFVATCARTVVADEPAIGFAFGARLIEQLRARADVAQTPAEREQAVRVVAVLSRNLSEVRDLLDRVRALPAEARA